MIKYLKRKNFRVLLAIVSFGLTPKSYAQFSLEYQQYSKMFPEDLKVRLLKETLIKIEVNKKGELEIKEETTEKDLYLNESVTYNSEGSINYSFFYDLEKIEASSYLFTEGKYKELEVESFKEKDNLDNSFYDGSKTLNFIYPNLKKGSISKLNYTYNIKNPRFLNPFYFGDFFPVVKNKITYIVDKDIEINFKKFNLKDTEVSFTKKENRKTNEFVWEVNNLDGYDYEYDSPTYKTVLPHIIPIINSYTKDKERVNLLSDVSDLYKWYNSLVENVNKEVVDVELKKTVIEIIKDKKTDLDKVKSIYYWVQQNIKYIAFEYALGGFIPRESNEVFKKKYGDCKDNSSILYRMFEIAGLKGNLTWIGTRTIPYTYEEVPTPIVDNHMILSYTENGKTYFLDATGRYMKLDLPTSFIQGKEALIANGENYRIEKVPIIDAEVNSFVDSTSIKLVGSKLIGTSKTQISGYSKIDFFNSLERINTETKLKDYYNGRFAKGNNAFLVLDYIELNKYDYDKDFIVDYNFEIDNYTKTLGDEVYLNLNLYKTLSDFKLDKKRKNAIEYRYKKAFNYHTIFEIPKGYVVDYLPESIKVSNDLIEGTISYKLSDNKIIYSHNIKINYILLNKEQQEKVNELIKKIEKNYKEIIVLKKQ